MVHMLGSRIDTQPVMLLYSLMTIHLLSSLRITEVL